MDSYARLKAFIDERLSGDASRIPELFDDESVLIELIKHGDDADWYHFEKKTFDGWYLVKTPEGFEVYEQDRGGKSAFQRFDELKSAAQYFFNSTGFGRR